MIRRSAVCTLGFLAVLWALAGPAAACDRAHSGADWACLYVEHVDTGVCQQNPLPQDLPVPVPGELQVVPDEVPELAPLAEGVIQLIPDVNLEVPSVGSLPDPSSSVPAPGSLVPNPNSLLPGSNPVPSDPTSLVPSPPRPPYEPTGLPGSPI